MVRELKINLGASRKDTRQVCSSNCNIAAIGLGYLEVGRRGQGRTGGFLLPKQADYHFPTRRGRSDRI